MMGMRSKAGKDRVCLKIVKPDLLTRRNLLE